MQSCGAALPEFDGLGLDAVAAPEGGEGDFAVIEFFADLDAGSR